MEARFCLILPIDNWCAASGCIVSSRVQSCIRLSCETAEVEMLGAKVLAQEFRRSNLMVLDVLCVSVGLSSMHLSSSLNHLARAPFPCRLKIHWICRHVIRVELSKVEICAE